MRTGASFERDPASGTIGQPSATDAGLSASSAGGVPIDTMIGNKYRVERVLGEGAMGIVLAARHVELDELVAIKCIRAEVPWSADILARFAREAKAAARLKSEHIAKVTDVGVSAPVGPYMVMEYLEGEDLARVLRRRGPIPARRAAEYVMQVCEALAAAHAASITHRDVKPANLFLTRSGALDVIKVLDFGVSKAPLRGRLFGGEMAVKETQSLIGTPLYMSPEQIRASHEVDHRSDLWSLGVVLFELLTGRAAFAGRTVAQVCTLVLEGSAPPLAQHCASAPAGLAEIIERCLMKDPAQRFQSAAELADALLPFAPARAR
ncbi:MAG TPA: serine/threonine-protein kinase, partial [Polyangiaceae bacterium]|nr:serine/threonine-protein kinase [Polyangiaceae bacterium]